MIEIANKIILAALIFANLVACEQSPSFSLSEEQPVENSKSRDSTFSSDDATAVVLPRVSPTPSSIAESQIRCVSKTSVINLQDSVEVEFETNINSEQKLKTSITSTLASGDIGSILATDAMLRIKYTAPKVAKKSFRVDIALSAEQGEDVKIVPCSVQVIGSNDIGVVDDGLLEGVAGNVYPLPANTARLPDLSLLQASAQLVVPNFNIPERAFSAGFPGVVDLVEWFAIRFIAKIVIPNNAVFRITSDDGANLYIDDKLVIDNDGTHAPKTATAVSTVAAGVHHLRLDYFQGPRYLIQLQLFWDLGDGAGFVLVPSNTLSRLNN